LHGRRELTAVLSVGGITLQVEGCAPDQVPEPSRAFLVDANSAEVTCEGTLGTLALPERDLLFDSGGVWRVDAGMDGGIRLVLRAGPHPGHPYHAVELNEHLTHGRVTLDPAPLKDEPEPFLLRAPLHELWTCFLLLRGRGALVHACGLRTHQDVHLFVGESGAGKSTLAGILESRFGLVLSDDRIVLRPDGGGFRAYGTPWHGEARFASPESGKVCSICFLSQAEKSRRIRLDPAEAALRLAACSFMAGWPLQEIKDLLGLCVVICESTPCYRLDFSPDDSAPAAAGLMPMP
jgi:hypothetical protein